MKLLNVRVLLLSILYCVCVTGSYEVDTLQNRCTSKVKNYLQNLQNWLSGDKNPLGSRQAPAVIIQHTWNKSLHTNFNCKFSIKAKNQRHGSGLYIAVTKLKFRKDPNTNSCVDYIELSKSGPNSSRRICDDIDMDGPSSKLIFNEREKEVQIEVFIDRRFTINEPLEMKLVVTFHSECMGQADEFQCDPDDGYSCISRELVNDGIANCMPPCRDEKSCFQRTITAEAIEPSSFALSGIALVAMVFTMLGVGTCIWVGWSYCNWGVPDHARGNQRQSRREQIAQTIEMPHSSYHSTTQITTNIPQSPDKDLPPSYESLFPDR